MVVEVPQWTEDEISAVAMAERVSTWREADTIPTNGTTDVSLDVDAPSELEARQVVRAALGVDVSPDAFLASTG